LSNQWFGRGVGFVGQWPAVTSGFTRPDGSHSGPRLQACWAYVTRSQTNKPPKRPRGSLEVRLTLCFVAAASAFAALASKEDLRLTKRQWQQVRVRPELSLVGLPQ
jgi:hypothetical protein